MATIVLEAHVSPDALLKAVDQLSLTELEQFVSYVLALRARRRAPGLPPEEAELLVKINQGIPTELRTRYDELSAKREAEALAREEHDELLAIVAQMEALQAERVESLAKLAQLRGVSLRALMDSLGIRGPDHG